MAQFNQNGVNKKQSPFVKTVTSSETASFPLAFLVQTEAAAMVQGTLPAIINPNAKSRVACNGISSQAITGIRPKFTNDAHNTGTGDRKDSFN